MTIFWREAYAPSLSTVAVLHYPHAKLVGRAARSHTGIAIESRKSTVAVFKQHQNLGGGCTYFLLSPLLGETIPMD